MPKLHFGSRGGIYYKKKGRKVYVPRRDFGYISQFGNTMSDTILQSVVDGDNVKDIKLYIIDNKVNIEELYKELEIRINDLDTNKQKEDLKQIMKYIKTKSGAVKTKSGAAKRPVSINISKVSDIKTEFEKDEKKAIDMVKKLIPNLKTKIKDTESMEIIEETIKDAINGLFEGNFNSADDAAVKFKKLLGDQKKSNTKINTIYEKLYPSGNEGSDYIEVPRGMEKVTKYRNLAESFNLKVKDTEKTKYKGLFNLVKISGMNDDRVNWWFAVNPQESEKELEHIINQYNVTPSENTRRGTRLPQVMEDFNGLSPEEKLSFLENINPTVKFGRFSHWSY